MVVTKLDRLGRSTRELLELNERIGKAGAPFRSLGDPWDTSSSQGRLLSTLLVPLPCPPPRGKSFDSRHLARLRRIIRKQFGQP